MEIQALIGIIGAAIILVFFILNETNKIKNTNFWYDFGNFVGGAFLIFYAIYLESWPFIILNVVWTGVAFRDVIKKLAKNNSHG